MLAALGVVEVRQGAGTYVSQLRAADIVRSLSLTVGLLPLDGLLEIYELRRVLEGHAAAQAAARRSEVLVERMDALLTELEACDDPTGTAELDHRFHTMIAEAGGNPTLAALLEVFRSRSRNYQIFDSASRARDQAGERRRPPGDRDRHHRPGRRRRPDRGRRARRRDRALAAPAAPAALDRGPRGRRTGRGRVEEGS